MKKYITILFVVLFSIPFITAAGPCDVACPEYIAYEKAIAERKEKTRIMLRELEKRTEQIKQAKTKNTVVANAPVQEIKQLSHRQIVWRNALEWCESAGVKTAINPLDADNTPSYYSFQWKPSTFKSFGIKYGVLSSTISNEEAFEKMKDYSLQVKIIDAMILDNTVKWNTQFPLCIKKIGLPPKN